MSTSRSTSLRHPLAAVLGTLLMWGSFYLNAPHPAPHGARQTVAGEARVGR
jgi:hypothetical protein